MNAGRVGSLSGTVTRSGLPVAAAAKTEGANRSPIMKQGTIALGRNTACDIVILSRSWRRACPELAKWICRDISGLVAAGRALSPECGLFGQNAAKVQIRSRHSGR